MSNASELAKLLVEVEQQAIKQNDGHLTIMRFTTGWKVMLGTPMILWPDGYAEILRLPSFQTLGEALRHIKGNLTV